MLNQPSLDGLYQDALVSLHRLEIVPTTMFQLIQIYIICLNAFGIKRRLQNRNYLFLLKKKTMKTSFYLPIHDFHQEDTLFDYLSSFLPPILASHDLLHSSFSIDYSIGFLPMTNHDINTRSSLMNIRNLVICCWLHLRILFLISHFIFHTMMFLITLESIQNLELFLTVKVERVLVFH